MTQDIEWAAERFAILGRHLRDAGEGGLRRELNQAITRATAPVTRSIRDHLSDYMPRNYADELDMPGVLAFPVSRLLGPNPGIRVRAISTGLHTKRSLKRLNAGILEHPLFGDREHWYDQTDGVTPGWFTKPLEDSAPAIRDAINGAVSDIEAQIVRGV